MARNALIQVRRDTAANWTSTNPTLAAGEMGFETDTGKLKIGTGSTAWTSLLYTTDASDITGTTLASNVVSSSLTSVGTLGSLAVSGVSSFGSEILATTSIAAGRGVGIKADPTNAQSILQFTDNAISSQWSSLVATNGLLNSTTPFKATQYIQGTDYLSPYQGFRNKAINGGFDIWQRGTSFSNPASGSYIADRASILYDGSGATRTISQGQFDPYVSGASITATPPTGTSPTYFLRYNQSVAGSGATYNILYINRTENVRVLAGKTVTVSFYAKAAANLTIGGVYFEQVFGSGGSPSSNVYSTISGSTSVTTSWQRFSYTVAVPSASGKVIGSSANSSYTGILMYLPINTTFTLDIWGLQVEEGSVATPFEQRPIGTELTLCERYYETSFRNGQTIGHNSGNFTMYPSSSLGCGGNSYFHHFYRTRKRSTNPTLRIFDSSAAHPVNENWWRYIDSCNSGTAVGPNVGVSLNADDVCISGYLQSGATGIAPIFDWTIEAEL